VDFFFVTTQKAVTKKCSKILATEELLLKLCSGNSIFRIHLD